MKIKLRIKKKYIGISATGISLFLSYYFLQKLYRWFIYQNSFELVLFLVFLTSAVYVIVYWVNLKNKENLAKEISHQIVKDGNLTEQDKLINHLYQKSYEDFYTFNLIKGKVKLTSSWAEQSQYENELLKFK